MNRLQPWRVVHSGGGGGDHRQSGEEGVGAGGGGGSLPTDVTDHFPC